MKLYTSVSIVEYRLRQRSRWYRLLLNPQSNSHGVSPRNRQMAAFKPTLHLTLDSEDLVPQPPTMFTWAQFSGRQAPYPSRHDTTLNKFLQTCLLCFPQLRFYISYIIDNSENFLGNSNALQYSPQIFTAFAIQTQCQQMPHAFKPVISLQVTNVYLFTT